MLKERLESLDSHTDRICLGKRLQIEAEHMKRIKCTRVVRIFTTPEKGVIRINTRIINPEKPDDQQSFWEVVKRVVFRGNSNLAVLSEDGLIDDESDSKDDSNVEESDSNEDRNVVGTIKEESTAPIEGDWEIAEWTSDCGGEAFTAPITEGMANAQILVKLANQRQVYKLNKKVRSLFNKYSDTKQNIIKDFYKYVHMNKLTNYSTADVVCDSALEEILAVKHFNFNDFNSLVEGLLEPIGYCVINVSLSEPQTWDIEVECDDLGHMPVLYPKNVSEMDKKIEATRASLAKVADKIEVLEKFIEDPVLFINRKIALESDVSGMQTGFFDDLAVQTAVFELIKSQRSD